MKVVALSSALVVGLVALAFASHIPPVHYGDTADEENNPSCAYLNPNWNEVKIDQAPNGDHADQGGTDNPGGDGPLVFTVTGSDGKTFNWESNMRVDAVVVKGGNRGSNVYLYGADEAKSDTGLRSPNNSQNKLPAISHISACYDTRAQQAAQEEPQPEEAPSEEPPQGQEAPQEQEEPPSSKVQPVVYGDGEGEENNPSCASLNTGWNELKINEAPNGEFRDEGGTDNPGGDGALVFTIENSDGKVFDWESNVGVDAVVVKGGNRGSNVYFYDPETNSDVRLRSPDNSQGNVPAVSHISVCYGDEPREEQEPTAQEEPPQEEPPQEEPPQEEPPQEEQNDQEQPPGTSEADPVVYGDGDSEENNPSCASLDEGWNELKINGAPDGEHRDTAAPDNPGGDGPLVFTVENSDGKVFDWESNIGVDAIVVQGGDGGSNTYFYDPESVSDIRLRSPDNSQGNVPAVSHISVCYDGDSQQQAETQEQTPQDEPPQEDGNQRPSEPDEPQEQDQPEDEGAEEPTDDGDTNERQSDEPEDEGTEEPTEEGEVEEDEAEGDVEGEFESDDGDADDIAEETSPFDDDDESSGGQLPFTGGAPGTLLLVGFVLTLVGAAVRFAQRTKAS